MRKIETVEMSDGDAFAVECERLLSLGYKLETCNCGFVDSEQYDFCASYMAIFSL